MWFYRIRQLFISDEPKSAKKPVRIAVLPKRPPLEQWNDSTTDRPTSSLLLKSLSLCDDLDPNARVDAPIGRKIIRPKSAKTTTRMSKKAAEEAEQARREKYAQELFDELNKSVFGNGLPENTKLNWNKRLLTTAGKARYRRYDLHIYIYISWMIIILHPKVKAWCRNFRN